MKKLKPKPHQIWAWCFTLTILTGALAAAFGFYPLYCYIFLIGNGGLAIVSWLWNEKSLVALNDTNIFKKASKFSKPVAKIKSGRLLLVKKCEDRWCKIKTGEYTGWVDSKYLWGSIK